MLTQWNESLWGDEGFSAIAVMQTLPETLGIVMRDTAPPLFYLVGWVWGKLFGYSEVSLRSLTLILMLGAAMFAGGIVYQLGKNKLNAVLVFLAAFLAPFLTPFAFEWRMYAMLNFSILGSVYFFVTKKWIPYILFSLAALYTHHFGIFTIAGEGIWFLINDFSWKKPKKYLGQLWPFLLIGVGYLPWIYPMYLQVTRVQGAGFWLSVPKLNEVIELVLRLGIGGVSKSFWLPVGALVLVALFFKDWKKKNLKSVVGLALIFLAPVLLSYLVSYLVTPIFYDRYLLSVAVGMVILIGLFGKKEAQFALIGLVLIYGFASYQQFTHPTKRPFREMAMYIKTVKTDKDVLLNYNGRSHHLWESKYYGVPAPIYTPGGPLPLYVGTAQMKPEDTTMTIPVTKGRLGVIASEPVEEVTIPGYKLLEYKEFGELRFSWWMKK